MILTLYQIYFALFMVAVTIGLFVWFRLSETAGSARRMMDMMTRVGLDSGITERGDPVTQAVLKKARRRCARCPSEGLCERWLCGMVGGGNVFCPNKRVFDFLK